MSVADLIPIKLFHCFNDLLSKQDISLKKYIAFSGLVILAADRATTVTEDEFVNFEHVFVS